MPIILIVDDDDAVRGILYELLSQKYECHTASTADEALQFLEVERYDAILTDIAMPGLDGISLFKRVQLREAKTPVILISGKGSEQDRKNLIDLGVFAFISKPFSLEEIEEVVVRAIAQKAG
jgi:two-component system, NtrC family, response regulator GlrR